MRSSRKVTLATVLALLLVGAMAAAALGAQSLAVSKIGANATHIAGADRYHTAVQLSKDAGWGPATVTTVYLVNGLDFPGAMTVGSFTATEPGPILLARPKVLPAVTAAEIKRLQPCQIIGVGNLSTAVLSQADKLITTACEARGPQ